MLIEFRRKNFQQWPKIEVRAPTLGQRESQIFFLIRWQRACSGIDDTIRLRDGTGPRRDHRKGEKIMPVNLSGYNYLLLRVNLGSITK
jgi:hypothetical protein